MTLNKRKNTLFAGSLLLSSAIYGAGGIPTLPGSDVSDPFAREEYADSLVHHTLETRVEELKTQKEDLLHKNSALREQFSTLKKNIQKVRARVFGVSNSDNASLVPEERKVVEGIVVFPEDSKNIVKILQDNIVLLTEQVEDLKTENSVLKQHIDVLGEFALELQAMLRKIV